MSRNYILSVLMLLFSVTLTAQTNLEKIYTQTDKPFYFPGETIWFKSYVVRGDNTVSTINDIVHAQLIAPNGGIVKKIELLLNMGYVYGDFNIDGDWIGGTYKLKIFTNWMRNFGEKGYFTKNIIVQKVVKPNVLLTLDFDKEGYGKGAMVTANFQAKDLKNRAFSKKTCKYRISVKGEIIDEKSLQTNTNGKAILNFKLPEGLSTRDVVLNVLVSNKGTTESISRSVPITLDNIDLQFFAESGKLVEGTNNKVGFKAIDEFAKPVAVQGIIVDENGTEIIPFKSFHDGMGAFNFSPLASKSYFALVKIPFVSSVKIPLPKVHTKGVHFGVTSKGLKIKIKLLSTLDKKLKLIIANSYNTLLEQEIGKNQKEIHVNTKKFPIGITKFTIVDAKGIPLAERLVFVNAHKQLKVSIDFKKEEYQRREKVTLFLKTTDENNKPIPANLSLAVVNNKILSFADDKQDHILSGLLISSELKGKIYKPSFYFNPKKKKSYKALDYLMLTHGWRDYITKAMDVDTAIFKPGNLTIQRGVVHDKNNKPVKAKLILFSDNGKNKSKETKVKKFETDKNGQFAFKYTDNIALVLLAYRDDEKKVHIVANKEHLERTADKNKKAKQKTAIKNVTKQKINNVINRVIKGKEILDVGKVTAETANSIFDSPNNGNDKLSEIVVSGSTSSYVPSYSPLFKAYSIANNNFSDSLFGKTPGVQITKSNDGGRNISIRGVSSVSGNNQPLLVVDGAPFESWKLKNLNSQDIRLPKVLKGATATTIYGSKGANGVIIISTKSGTVDKYREKKFKKKRFKNYNLWRFYSYQGSIKTNFYKPRNFYVPRYNKKNKVLLKNDFRQTIYWNPVVLTNANGKAKVSFYNSDAITSFKITSEGIGYNGLVGRQEKDYATKNKMSLDFKMPNYMVLKDTINVPVIFTNETNKNITLSSRFLGLSDIAELKENTLEHTIKANSSIVKYFTIIPTKKIKNKSIWLRVTSKDGLIFDQIEKKVTVLSPYFPTRLSISGIKAKAYDFNINNIVDGTLQSDFKVYTDVVGEVMDGIDGIIREPSGCFEQVSSSTYPNILVLKYLRETKKINPEIEKKAMNYIKKGYKKLAGYETSKDGFEWFGRTPPHEALSAYGLMEFTEMKEVYNGVDEKMLQRTIAFLLRRRNGKGGFKQNKGKYGFSEALESVNNAYIVYAISESKIKANIEKEYLYTFQEALKSEDTYRMALLACTSYNFNKIENYKLLMTKIKNNIDKKGFAKLPVENTITRSYGNTKNIETLAFTILAMLKDKEGNEVKIIKGIEYLLSQRKQGRFASTQSTSMVLKALIEYSKTHKSKIKGSTILSLNNKHIKQDLTKKYKVGKKNSYNNLGSYFKEGKQKVAVKFENSETNFPYSLNITYDSYVPESSEKSPLLLDLAIPKKTYKVGDNVSMEVNVSNKNNENLGMVTAIIGFPSGTTPQPWQLAKLVEEKQVAYYEIFDNYLVFYWREFGKKESKTIRLDLKADISGSYQAPASTVYLYYGDEFKTWVKGNKLKIGK